MSTPESTTTPNPTNPADTKVAVQQQIEYYFSLENLPNDTFLLSKMDSERFVPISLLASFGKIQNLTQDISVLVEAIEESKCVELSSDKSGVRFLDTRKKTTLILYNLPSGTTDQILLDLFAKGSFELTVASDINNCWFVECIDEDTAAVALQFIKAEKLDGKSIRARLRPIRNIYAALDSYNPNFAPPSYSYAPAYVYNEWTPESSAPGVPMFWNSQSGAYGPGRARKGKRDNRKDGNKKRVGKKNKGKDAKKQTPVPLRSSDFPPLPSTTGENTGYSGDFKQYTGAAIISAWKEVSAEGVESCDFPFQAKSNEELSSLAAKPIERADVAPRSTSGRSRSKSHKKKNAPKPVKDTPAKAAPAKAAPAKAAPAKAAPAKAAPAKAAPAKQATTTA